MPITDSVIDEYVKEVWNIMEPVHHSYNQIVKKERDKEVDDWWNSRGEEMQTVYAFLKKRNFIHMDSLTKALNKTITDLTLAPTGYDLKNEISDYSYYITHRDDFDKLGLEKFKAMLKEKLAEKFKFIKKKIDASTGGHTRKI